jgi:serine/threonine-protein kinase
LPADLARICLRALERDKERRYQHAGEMGFELERYMYHDRFGPTNVTLSQYLRALFGAAESTTRMWSPSAAPVEDEAAEDHVVQRRADTLYRELM